MPSKGQRKKKKEENKMRFFYVNAKNRNIKFVTIVDSGKWIVGWRD